MTFTGWTLDNTPEANIPPVTNRALNFLSYGGGNLNGGACPLPAPSSGIIVPLTDC